MYILCLLLDITSGESLNVGEGRREVAYTNFKWQDGLNRVFGLRCQNRKATAAYASAV